MRQCSHGCGEIADIEMGSMSRKDFKMDSNSVLKFAPGLFKISDLGSNVLPKIKQNVNVVRSILKTLVGLIRQQRHLKSENSPKLISLREEHYVGNQRHLRQRQSYSAGNRVNKEAG